MAKRRMPWCKIIWGRKTAQKRQSRWAYKCLFSPQLGGLHLHLSNFALGFFT
jgi:hypothetical protein